MADYALDWANRHGSAGRDGGPAAGVPVTTIRSDGITHDVVMLNPVSGTHATGAAGAQAIAVLREAFQGATRVHHHSYDFREVLALA